MKIKLSKRKIKNDEYKLGGEVLKIVDK